MLRTTALFAALLIFATTAAFAHDPPKTGASAAPNPQARMQGNMKVSGDQDYDFAMMMRDHHKMALPMAQKEIKNGKDPAMRLMAHHIVAAQTKEIGDFDCWLASHKALMKTER